MDQEQEIQELKTRLAALEKQLQSKNRPSGIISVMIGFIIVFALCFISIGVVHFISTSTP